MLSTLGSSGNGETPSKLNLGCQAFVFKQHMHILVCLCACSFTKSCLILCNNKDSSPPGSSVMGFPRQEYCSGLLFPLQGIFPNQRSNPHLLPWQADPLLSELPGKPMQILSSHLPRSKIIITQCLSHSWPQPVEACPGVPRIAQILLSWSSAPWMSENLKPPCWGRFQEWTSDPAEKKNRMSNSNNQYSHLVWPPREGDNTWLQYPCLGKWTAEPVGLLCVGSQRVGHDLATTPPPSSCLNSFKHFGLQATLETRQSRGELKPGALFEFL